MSYARYESYSDSGLQWLGKIPSHWEVVQSRRLFEQRKERARDGDEQLTASQKYGIISQKKFMELENQRVVQVLTGSELLKHIEPNDFVISMRSFQGGLEWSRQSGCVSSAYIGLIPIKHVVPEFYNYLFKCGPYIQALQSTSNLVRDGQALRFENFSQVWLPIIPDDEQQKIANFLDHETAKIDTLIDKQQQLIRLLKEKRQAVISHAVTKGLNPNAPMRDSGIEWLGEVPEHWRSIPLRLIVRTRKGVAFKSADFCDGGIRVVKASDIKQKTIRETDVFLPEGFVRDYPKALLSTRDIILSTVGSNPDVINSAVGQIGMVPKNLNGSLLNQNTVVFDPDENRVSREYLFYVLQMEGYRKHLDIHAHGTANQSSLSIEDMLNFTISFPTLKEQYEVCQYIRQRQKVLDDLETKASISESLLKERRTALISAAVTGKIDVRHPVCHPTGDLQSSKSTVHGDL